jgi:C-terminal processing protease CtpA/Prc
MVILAGAGHLAYREGIPQRLERRVKLSSAVVLNEPNETLSQELADIVLLPIQESLPPKGMMGVQMESAKKGVRIVSFAEKSAAKAVGIEQGDHIVQIDGEAMVSTMDVELALLDRKPGQTLEVAVLRSAGSVREKLLRYRVELR